VRKAPELSKLSRDRLADFPAVSEGVGHLAHPPVIGLVGDRPGDGGSGVDGAG